MHEARAGETERLAGEALETSAQGEALTLNLLHRQFSYCVLYGREMPPMDSRLVCVIPGDAKGFQQGAKSQELRILPCADDVRERSSGAMIERMPQPPLGLFGTNKTLHFIALGRAAQRNCAVV